MNSKSEEISQSINAKIELSIAIEELAQISERFLSSIHVVQNNALNKLTPLEDAVEKARNLVAILKDIFEPRIVKKEPKLKSPAKKKSKQGQSVQNYGQHISDVVTDSEHQLELITGFREGSICMIVNKIHRFGMKDSSRYPLIKWDCCKRKDDGCSAGFSTKIVNVEEVDKLCEGQEKRDKAKCPEAVHTLSCYNNINNHSDHLVEEPCSSKSQKKKQDISSVKLEANTSYGSGDENTENYVRIDESDVVMIDSYDSKESFIPVTGSKDHNLQLIPGKTKGSICMLVDKKHKFCMKDSSSYPLIKWACAKRKACECNAAFSTRIVNADVVDQVFFNEPARVKSKCVQAVHELVGYKSIDRHSNHSNLSVKVKAKVDNNGSTSDHLVGNGGQSSNDKTIPMDCVSDTTDDEEPDEDKILDQVVESEAVEAPGKQDIADSSDTTNTPKVLENLKPKSEFIQANDSSIKFSPTKNKRKKQQKFKESKQYIVSSLMDNQFECRKCAKTASSRRGIEYHIQSFHEGVQHLCSQCPYKAGDRSTLAKHERATHDGIRYPCNQCNFKATQKPGLRNHIKSIHGGV